MIEIIVIIITICQHFSKNFTQLELLHRKYQKRYGSIEALCYAFGDPHE
ncbi:MAG: hypothetical protein LBC11_00215 [Puniceicoccales bacterium]|nr:hypothetical protein [Puniceicoccales bacterium]